MLPFPNNVKVAGSNLTRTLLPRRRNKLVVAVVGVICTIFVVGIYSHSYRGSTHRFGSITITVPLETPPDQEFPPLYEEYAELERKLPQHDLSLPFPEGRHGRYLYPGNHVWGLGWNNILQEHILLSHLAYTTNRSFVFDTYTWAVGDNPYAEYNGRLIPSRIPMNALLSGPASGGPYAPGDQTPRAVTHQYYNVACPYEERTIISQAEADKLHEELSNAPADEILWKWVERINSLEGGCIEIDMMGKQIWDFYVFGSDRILSLWPSLSKSPILTRFAWSPLVMAGVEANAKLFTPSHSLLQKTFGGLSNQRTGTSDPYEVLPGLLAIHVRRGDYDQHCRALAEWGSSFHGWCQLDSIPDRFAPSPGAPDHLETAMNHCWPTIEQIVEKVRQVRATPAGKGLQRVFIMTNGDRKWVQELKNAIHKLGNWEDVKSSRDLRLNQEQKYIAQAIDMVIAQKSQVFIGNGFSSLTANVFILREAKHVPPNTNRLF